MSVKAIADRLWPRVDVRGADECWPWLGPMLAKGYGQFNWRPGGSSMSASRAAYMLHHGIEALPRDRHVCHSCDNPPCCNPAHLWLGSALDNMRDMVAKGRSGKNHGEDCPHARLTAADVTAIRASSESNQSLSARFGVTHQNINRIRKRLTWRHVDSVACHYDGAGRGKVRAKLAEHDVREIRAAGNDVFALAARFGVSVCTIRDIHAGRTWRHVTSEVAA